MKSPNRLASLLLLGPGAMLLFVPLHPLRLQDSSAIAPQGRYTTQEIERRTRHLCDRLLLGIHPVGVSIQRLEGQEPGLPRHGYWSVDCYDGIDLPLATFEWDDETGGLSRIGCRYSIPNMKRTQPLTRAEVRWT